MRSYYGERRGLRNRKQGLVGPMGLAYEFIRYLELFREHNYLLAAEGRDCVGARVSGTMGPDPNIFSKERIGLPWPPVAWGVYEEHQVFDLIEFTFDLISKPTDGHFCSRCGRFHASEFDYEHGRRPYRAAVNHLLKRYVNGAYELSADGVILSRTPEGFSPLLESRSDFSDHALRERVDRAIREFRQPKSAAQDRRRAVRELADVLETLRPVAKQHLASRDEADLFELANRYAIRHHNDRQKGDYDLGVWADWQFYYYLATIRALVAIVERGLESGA